MAIRDMIAWLVVESEKRGCELTKEEAYILCSTCVDLKICEIVDVPNMVVGARFPLGVFV
jgi:acetamidase/formamidase